MVKHIMWLAISEMGTALFWNDNNIQYLRTVMCLLHVLCFFTAVVNVTLIWCVDVKTIWKVGKISITVVRIGRVAHMHAEYHSRRVISVSQLCMTHSTIKCIHQWAHDLNMLHILTAVLQICCNTFSSLPWICLSWAVLRQYNVNRRHMWAVVLCYWFHTLTVSL